MKTKNDKRQGTTEHTEKLAAARLSLVSNICLTALKLLVGLLSGSVSVVAEAAHSVTDVVASSFALYSVRVSDRPPDFEHPFGYGKVENMSALAQGLFLLGVAGFIIYEACEHLVHHTRPEKLGLGMGVMVISAIVNVFVMQRVQAAAAKTDSQALHADAQDHRADILGAVGVLIGLVLVWATGHSYFDSAMALGVALLIAHGAWGVMQQGIAVLLDTQLPPEDLEKIRSVFVSDPNVRAYHKLRTRKAGSTSHVDAHVLLDDDLTLLAAHDLTEQLEEHIRAALPQSVVTLHTEPYRAERRHQLEEHGRIPDDEVCDLGLRPGAGGR